VPSSISHDLVKPNGFAVFSSVAIAVGQLDAFCYKRWWSPEGKVGWHTHCHSRQQVILKGVRDGVRDRENHKEVLTGERGRVVLKVGKGLLFSFGARPWKEWGTW